MFTLQCIWLFLICYCYDTFIFLLFREINRFPTEIFYYCLLLRVLYKWCYILVAGLLRKFPNKCKAYFEVRQLIIPRKFKILITSIVVFLRTYIVENLNLVSLKLLAQCYKPATWEQSDEDIGGHWIYDRSSKY